MPIRLHGELMLGPEEARLRAMTRRDRFASGPADLVLPMMDAQKHHVRRIAPGLVGHVFPFPEFVGKEGGRGRPFRTFPSYRVIRDCLLSLV